MLRALGIQRTLLVTSERWRTISLPVAGSYYGVRHHAPLGLGGGSAIDTAKAVSARRGSRSSRSRPRLACFERLRDLGVGEREIDAIAEAAASRAGARRNPRPASPAEIAGLYRSIY